MVTRTYFCDICGLVGTSKAAIKTHEQTPIIDILKVGEVYGHVNDTRGDKLIAIVANLIYLQTPIKHEVRSVNHFHENVFIFRTFGINNGKPRGTVNWENQINDSIQRGYNPYMDQASFRILTPHEWEKLKPILRLPNFPNRPETSIIEKLTKEFPEVQLIRGTMENKKKE